MAKDRLYLLKPDFKDAKTGVGPYFCAECALVEGMLGMYPRLRKDLDVRYVTYPRPRPDIVSEIGEENQSAPVLILGESPQKIPVGVEVKQAKGKRFIHGDWAICNYIAGQYGAGAPHK